MFRTVIHRVELFAALALLSTAPVSYGHIRIFPAQSTFGAREKYTMRVPNERQSPTTRIEGEFPAGLDVYDFEFKPAWKIEFRKDAQGKITGAVWTGRIEPYEFVEFGMLAINPKDGDGKLFWKFVQYYADGTKEDFTAPPDAKTPLLPMPLVTLTAAGGTATPVAGAADAGSLVGQGKDLFSKYRCYECHGMNGEGTPDAPDLIGTRLNGDQISAFLQKPSADASTKGMPNFAAASPDLAPLVAYVLSLKKAQ